MKKDGNTTVKIEQVSHKKSVMKSELKKVIKNLLEWYPEHKRDLPWRKDQNPYHIWISEIMLQQTRVEAVKEYYKRFLSALPTISDLASVKEDELLKLWQGLGYYNRARNLQIAAQQIEQKYGGVFPQTYDEIRGLKGIGDYTAGAIGAICYDLKTPAVDGNVLRVYSRILEDERVIDAQTTKKQVCDELAAVYPKSGSGTLNQAFMELGACVCVPNGAPHCNDCPVAKLCKANQNGSWKQYPVRQEKKKRKIVDKTVLIMICDGKVAISKRDKKGLLASMWEFPGIEEIREEQGATNLAAESGCQPDTLLMKTSYTHIFSHVEWRMDGYYMQVLKQSEKYTWATLDELQKVYAIPSAYAPFYQVLVEKELLESD